MSLFAGRQKCECGRWFDKGGVCGCDTPTPTNEWERKGWECGLDGVTCCPYSGDRGERWHKGYQKARAAGLAKLPSFRELRR